MRKRKTLSSLLRRALRTTGLSIPEEKELCFRDEEGLERKFEKLIKEAQTTLPKKILRDKNILHIPPFEIDTCPQVTPFIRQNSKEGLTEYLADEYPATNKLTLNESHIEAESDGKAIAESVGEIGTHALTPRQANNVIELLAKELMGTMKVATKDYETTALIFLKSMSMSKRQQQTSKEMSDENYLKSHCYENVSMLSVSIHGYFVGGNIERKSYNVSVDVVGSTRKIKSDNLEYSPRSGSRNNWDDKTIILLNADIV